MTKKHLKTRNTIQRIKIIDYLKSVKTHPTAEMVYNAVVKDIPTITLATVYRNLNLLAEQRQILKFEVNKEFRFDGDTCNHQHCVCRKCDKIMDSFKKNISQYALNNINSNEFKADCVNIMFNGTCKKCSAL